MFLAQKYGLIKSNYQYTKKDITEDVSIWLQELFKRTPYDRYAISLFRQESYFMLNFIEDELLKDDGLIKLIFPRGMYDQNNRRSYEKATAYFLLNQHYSKLQDIQKDDTVKKCLWTLGLINNAADFDSIKNTAKKTQWRLYADNLLSPCIWAGEEYEPQTEGCVQIGIEVTTYTDFNYKPEHQKKIK